jgi:hypothetical protein
VVLATLTVVVPGALTSLAALACAAVLVGWLLFVLQRGPR